MSNVLNLSGALRAGIFSTAERPDPELGLIYFDTDLGKFQQCVDGATYTDIPAGSIVGVIYSDGSVPFAANQSMGGFNLTNVANPVNPQDAATKDYVDDATVSVANQQLSNLNPTSINQSLVPDSDGSWDLGAVSLRWNNVYASALKDQNDAFSVDIQARQLYDQNEITSVDWDLRQLMDAASAIKVDWSVAGEISVNNNKITNLDTPVDPTDAANKGYVDSSISAGAGANYFLSNLQSPTSINQHLLPSGNLVRNLGSSGLRWLNVWAQDVNASNSVVSEIGDFGTSLTATNLTAFGTSIIGPITVDGTGIDMDGTAITNLLDPVNAQDAATKNYVTTFFIPLTQKGAPNGVATLDGGGKIPSSQLPTTVMDYKGNWNASTNTPTLADGIGDAGDVYLVNVAGTQNLGSGSQTFAVGDWVVYNGSIWQKSTNSNAVVSVNGFTGVVVLAANDVGAANRNLSNLQSATAINQHLLPDANGTRDLGAFGTAFRSIIATSDILTGAGATITGGQFQSNAAPGNTIGAASSPTGVASTAGYYSVTAATHVSLFSATTAAANASLSGDVLIETGNRTAGTGNSGAIKLQTGTSAGGTRGNIEMDATMINLRGVVHRTAAGGGTSWIEEQYIHSVAISASTTAVVTAFTFAFATYEGCEITYKVKEATTNAVRVGRIMVATNGTDVSCVDVANDTADLGLSWSAAVNGANIEISYTKGANAATMRADVKRFLT